MKPCELTGRASSLAPAEVAVLFGWALAAAAWSGHLVANGSAGRLLGALLGCTGGLLWLRSARPVQGPAARAGAVLGLGVATWAPLAVGPLASLVGGIATAVWVLAVGDRDGRPRALAAGLAAAAVWCEVYRLLLRSAAGWHAQEAVARAVCTAAGLAARTPVDADAEVLAVPAAITLGFVLLSTSLARRSWSPRPALAWLVWVAVVVLFGAVAQGLLVPGRVGLATALARSQGISLAATALLVLGAALTHVRLAGASARPAIGTAARLSTLLPAALLATGVLFTHEPDPPAGRGTLLVYRDNDRDFARPRPGRAGRFGLLATHLRSYGFAAREVRAGELRQTLSQADAVVFPQPTRRLSAADLQAVWQFIHQGGGLLYIADHTDVSGCRGPANEILAPLGIEVNFDTALPARDGWPLSLTFADHPVTRGLGSDAYEAAWWSGASLHIAGDVVPAIVGRRGLADLGRRGNPSSGFLGNYRADRGERLGGLVLAAAAQRGRGRLVVAGDSSCWQNLAAADAWRLCRRTVSWVAAGQSDPGRAGRRWLGVAALCAGCVALGCTLSLSAALCAGLAVTVCVVAAAQSLPRSGPGPQAPLAACVWRPPLAPVSARQDDESGLEAFLTALSGAGGIARVCTEYNCPPPGSCRCLVVFAPGAGPRVREPAGVSDWVAAGGALVVVCGPDHWSRLCGWGSLSGAQVGSEPLGYGPPDRGSPIALHARAAYALELTRDWTPLAARFGKPFVACRRYGAGVVVLIADPVLLTNRGMRGDGVANRWLRQLAAPSTPGP